MTAFDHELYLKTLAPRAPLRYRVPSFCQNCEEPILPPAANGSISFCPECRATPEYQMLATRPTIYKDGDHTDCSVCHTWNVSSHRIGETFLCQECVNEIATAATSA